MIPSLGGNSFIHPDMNQNADVLSMQLPVPLEFRYMDWAQRGRATNAVVRSFGGAEAEVGMEPSTPENPGVGFRVTARVLAVHGTILVDRIE